MMQSLVTVVRMAPWLA